MQSYYFRVDGGSIYSVATGHIFRCLKLAEYLAKHNNVEIFFIMKDYKEGVDLVNQLKFPVILLSPQTTFDEEIRIIKNKAKQNSIIICDVRKIGQPYISQMKEHFRTFVLFDDLGIKNVNPDILINPAPYCYNEYNKRDYPKSALLLGEKFFFLSKQLKDNSCKRDFRKEKFSIMASFGGADPMNITEVFIQRLVPCISEFDISIILGPAYLKKDEIKTRYGSIKNIRFIENVSPLDRVFLKHNIAFVCGGDTCIEACASGMATFIIASIYYEKKTAELLHKSRMAYFVGDIEGIKRDGFSNGCLRALKNKDFLNRIASYGRNLTDGKGLERVCRILSENN